MLFNTTTIVFEDILPRHFVKAEGQGGCVVCWEGGGIKRMKLNLSRCAVIYDPG